jgi:hypothetical protein
VTRAHTVVQINSGALKEATDIMHYEGRLPVTALEGCEIERAYGALCSVSGESARLSRFRQAGSCRRGGSANSMSAKTSASSNPLPIGSNAIRPEPWMGRVLRLSYSLEIITPNALKEA